MNNYTIRCIGFEKQDKKSFFALFDLAERALNSSWKLVDHVDGDIDVKWTP